MLCSKLRRTTSHHWNDRREASTTPWKVGGVKTFITFWYHTNDHFQGSKYSSCWLINEVNIIIQSNLLNFIDGINWCGLWKNYNRGPNQSTQTFQLLFRCVLRTLTFWLTGFPERYKRIWPVYCLQYQFEVICNRFIEEEDRTRLWKQHQKILLNQ